MEKKELSDIKSKLLEMGGAVETALIHIADGLEKKQKSLFDDVRTIEDRINSLHIEVDSLCLNVLARQSPVAKDLRFILSCIKMNTDLERMGDQCMNISFTGADYLLKPPLAEISELQEMFLKVRLMVKRSLDSFVYSHIDEANAILMLDDEIDKYKNDMFQKMIQVIKGDSNRVTEGLDLILIARNLERIADHCTNIAEDVIFALTGADVRHGG